MMHSLRFIVDLPRFFAIYALMRLLKSLNHTQETYILRRNLPQWMCLKCRYRESNQPIFDVASAQQLRLPDAIPFIH